MSEAENPSIGFVIAISFSTRLRIPGDPRFAAGCCYAPADAYPRRHLRLDHQTGSTQPGKRADLVVFPTRDSFVDVSHVWIDGVNNPYINNASASRPEPVLAAASAATFA